MVSTEGHPSHTTEVNLIGPGIQSIDPGWHIKLTVRNSPLTWCIDTGAQISVMPETVYQPTFGNLVKPDRKLVGPLDTTGYADMELCHATKQLWLGRSATAETAGWQNVPRYAECRYAQIEKEALATTWALEHWADLLAGMTFRVETDHKPLVPLLSTKLIDELLLCIQRFRMRLINYAIHVPGKFLYTADPCPMPRSIKIRPRVKNSSLK